MKSRINPRPRIYGAGLAVIFLLAQGTPVASAYDAPTFDSKVISADGIFWSASEKQSLLEALASLAVNFPSSRQVDSDLQEKSLGLALQIDPLHYSSRLAHQALATGKAPEKTDYFDSLSAISEALWRTASTLLAPPAEPEEIRLAPYLMEISLLIHPDPPADRMESFALHTRGGSPGWKRFLELDAENNPSSRRAQMLRMEASEILRNTLNKEPEPGEDPDRPSDPIPMGPNGIFTENRDPDKPPTNPPGPTRPMRPDPTGTGTPFEPIAVSIPTIRNVSAIDSAPVLGELELTIRPPVNDIETTLFPFLRTSPPSDYPSLPLLSALRGVDLENLEVSAAEAAQRGLTWPGPVIGLVAFEATTSLPGPRRLSSTSGWLPTLAALEVALGDAELNPNFLLAGSVDEPGATPQIPGEIEDFIQILPVEGVDYLLTPESVLEDVVLHLQINEDLEILFERTWVSYPDASTAVETLTAETDPALIEAGKTFDEVAQVAERMPLVELARNAKVQERLATILNTYPRHLSARAMLEFGNRPVPEEVQQKATATRIAKLVEPFLQIGEDPAILNELRGIIDENKLSLSRMRLNLAPELLDFHSQSEDVLTQAEAYLGLTNLTTSIAAQKLRELQEAIVTWKSSYQEIFSEP